MGLKPFLFIITIGFSSAAPREIRSGVPVSIIALDGKKPCNITEVPNVKSVLEEENCKNSTIVQPLKNKVTQALHGFCINLHHSLYQLCDEYGKGPSKFTFKFEKGLNESGTFCSKAKNIYENYNAKESQMKLNLKEWVNAFSEIITNSTLCGQTCLDGGKVNALCLWNIFVVDTLKQMGPKLQPHTDSTKKLVPHQSDDAKKEVLPNITNMAEYVVAPGYVDPSQQGKNNNLNNVNFQQSNSPKRIQVLENKLVEDEKPSEKSTHVTNDNGIDMETTYDTETEPPVKKDPEPQKLEEPVEKPDKNEPHPPFENNKAEVKEAKKDSEIYPAEEPKPEADTHPVEEPKQDEADLHPAEEVKQDADLHAESQDIDTIKNGKEFKNTFIETEDSNFGNYFIFMCVAGAVIVLLFHYKTKLLALALEGRKSRMSRNRGRFSTASYSRLHSNLEEAIASNTSAPTSSHVLY